MKNLVIGSRGSKLALWQANRVKKDLETIYPGTSISIDIIKTEGDKILDVALSEIGNKGLFTKTIEDSLLSGKIDIAVHSLKDLPTVLPVGLIIGAVSIREDPHDAFISLKHNSIYDLPHGARVATGSLRRTCQLLNYRSDLNVVDVRGNIETRLKKLENMEWDGMILAAAGIKRLGLDRYLKQIIPEDIMLPAVSQGVMGIEIRAKDNELQKFLEPINNEESMYSVTAERSMLKTVEGGCQVPVGVYTNIKNNIIKLDAMIGSLDGRKIVRCSVSDNKENAELLGRMAGTDMLERGGREILASIRP